MISIFRPEMKDKKCKHRWEKLSTQMKANGGFLGNKLEINYEYFFCLKCDSTKGDEINY